MSWFQMQLFLFRETLFQQSMILYVIPIMICTHTHINNRTNCWALGTIRASAGFRKPRSVLFSISLQQIVSIEHIQYFHQSYVINHSCFYIYLLFYFVYQHYIITLCWQDIVSLYQGCQCAFYYTYLWVRCLFSF